MIGGVGTKCGSAREIFSSRARNAKHLTTHDAIAPMNALGRADPVQAEVQQEVAVHYLSSFSCWAAH